VVEKTVMLDLYPPKKLNCRSEEVPLSVIADLMAMDFARAVEATSIQVGNS